MFDKKRDNQTIENEFDRSSEVDRSLDNRLEGASKADEHKADELTMEPEKPAKATKTIEPTELKKSSFLGMESLEKKIKIKLGKFSFKITKKLLLLLILNGILVTSLFIVNYFMFREVDSIFASINLIAGFIFIFPIIMIKYSEYKKRKEVEDLFPVFLRDFVESIRGGMTIPHALKSVSKNDYKALSPHVKKMAIQLDWGITVERVLLNFSKRAKSRLISRIVSSVRESHRFGGNLPDTLEALSNTAVEVDRLREERRLYLNSQIITGYIIFFVFLAVIIALEKFLVPSLTGVSVTGFIGETPTMSSSAPISADEYKTIFRNLIVIQGFFAGLAVGKMAEGAIIPGLKHSMFMMFIGSLVFALAV